MCLCRASCRVSFKPSRPGISRDAYWKSISQFRVIEHVVPAQHTRHWPRGTDVGYENTLRIAVKQYVPKSNNTPQIGDVTFIAAHANGFPKELYEPLFEELQVNLSTLGRRIRGIWIADIAHQGQSGILNEEALGNDPNWWDFARDLLFLINQKQDQMPQPLVGIGHSMGGSQLAQLALIHPGLLQALILIDPVIQTENPSKAFAKASTYRRDLWPSRTAAAQSFASSRFYQAWDRRVLERWVKYGLRDLPTELYPERGDGQEPPVTLTTTKAQEVFSYLRPKYYGSSGIASEDDRDVYGDMHPDDVEKEYPFYRPEPAEIFRRLPELKPPVLYIFGKSSELATPTLRRKKMETTGIGVGGSGGERAGRVKEVVLECGHLVPMEKERIGMDDEWREMIGPKAQRS
ncbi:Alpha/beta hydrolase family-domain-containing protein [Exophiala viscosa]|uniref:Alpha/beta hydrolase family-domain-containing protein n=1 Tax=Exophiala viscosa TaxID=2486360 RepID=A0AAN6I9W9_9EURO|nr:Alpha/beta hydrolase family-domain-containing protein [Exophiala viscosa]